LKLIIVGVVVFGALAGLVIGYLQPHVEGLKSIAMIMSSIYNMLVLVVLMGYGLFNLPIYLWKRQDNRERLYAELETAEVVRKEYRSSMADFYTIVSQCKNMVASHKTAANAEYMEILQKELPDKDLEGQTIGVSKNFTLDIAKG
jgi:ABC-type transport system involved in cytochrome c biogenesis permease subunit